MSLDIPDWMLTVSEPEFIQRMTDAMQQASRGYAPATPHKRQKQKWRVDFDPILRAVAAGTMPAFHGLPIESQAEELDRTVGDNIDLGMGLARSGPLMWLLRFGREQLTDAVRKAAIAAKEQMDLDTVQRYTNGVQSRQSLVTVDLNQLQTPEQAKPLVDIIQNADLASSTLMAIREAVNARLSSASDLSDLPKLEAKHEAELHAARRERVFGKAEPNLPGLQAYLDRLAKMGAPSDLDDVSTIVGTVNYWRQQLEADFFIPHASSSRAKPKLVPCRLKPLTGNRYQVLGLGELKDANLYNEQRFPPLVAKPASQGSA